MPSSVILVVGLGFCAQSLESCRSSPAGQLRLSWMIRQATQGPGCFRPDPDRRGSEIGQRDLLTLDDAYRRRVRPGRHGTLAGFVARLVERGLPAARSHVEDP